MCGITGWVTKDKDLRNLENIVKDMTGTLSKRGPDEEGICLYNNAILGHKRLVVVDPKGGHQPMTKMFGSNVHTIVYNGEIYNTEEVRNKLKEKGYRFNSYSDTEVLLTAYIEWKEECLDYINGIFAFAVWDENEKSLFLVRDPLGVKPLFYSNIGNSLIFASEIKALLAHPMIEPVVNREGLLEIIGLGPARSLGNGVFSDIKEVPPAHFLKFDKYGMKLKEYWSLKAEEHKEDLRTTIEHTRELLVDAIERQLVADVPICTFLSGGLDSSAISAIAANAFRREGKGQLNTFSIDYEDNSKYFKSSEFQPNSDSEWVGKMVDFIGSNHTNVEIDNVELAYALYDAVRASDLPGMADIDSSLYLFCKEVRKKATVALSGECADEVFGGYPWFTREEDIYYNGFPWAKSVEHRRSILSEEFKDLPLEEYVAQQYKDTIKKVPLLEGETLKEQKLRELSYLNIKWFMLTLLNRKDRMSMSNCLEVRVPFADYRLVQYAYNIPSEMKFYNNREKGLLREALKGILPYDIIFRKKSPYPKTHNPQYTKAVQNIMRGILNDKSSPILNILNIDKVEEIVQTSGNSFKKPWYGQLMTGPQVIAYLIQIDTWMRAYNVKIQG